MAELLLLLGLFIGCHTERTRMRELVRIFVANVLFRYQTWRNRPADVYLERR